jgi:hypothetical protein
LEKLQVKVGDRVRRTQESFEDEGVVYLGGQCMNDLCGTLFRVVVTELSGLIHLEVFEAGGVLPQGQVVAVPHVYFTVPYWQVVPPLILQLADASGLKATQAFLKEKHYMRREVHDLARPVAYQVLREHDRELVGAILYSRPQAARTYGSARDLTPELGRWGNIGDVRRGRVTRTQWEIINLSRFYLSPLVQRRDSRDYVANAASILLAQSLWSVCVDYLKVWPPAYFDEPWELAECVSYCESDRFFCTLYLASAFQLIRTNRDGLQTYARPLRGLMPHEKREIRQASLSSEWAREHRAEREFESSMEPHPFMQRSWPRTADRAA